MIKFKENWTKLLISIIFLLSLALATFIYHYTEMRIDRDFYKTKYDNQGAELEFYKGGYLTYQLKEADLIKAGASKQRAIEIIKASQILPEYVNYPK